MSDDLHIRRLEHVADKLSDTAEKLVIVMERQEGQAARLDKLEERQDKADDRIDALREDHNKWKNRVWGAWAVVTAAFSAFTYFRPH